MTEKKSNRSFKDLSCWVKARQIRISVSEISGKFPIHEKFVLTQQVVRSSRSVCSNIAEGWGRFNYQDHIRFCRIARGSLYETLDHLTTALDEKYITELDYKKFENDIFECARILNGFIKYLQESKKNNNAGMVEEGEMDYVTVSRSNAEHTLSNL
ncbi:MAG: four helix bundle protein [Flavobacteriales bacterium]